MACISTILQIPSKSSQKGRVNIVCRTVIFSTLSRLPAWIFLHDLLLSQGNFCLFAYSCLPRCARRGARAPWGPGQGPRPLLLLPVVWTDTDRLSTFRPTYTFFFFFSRKQMSVASSHRKVVKEKERKAGSVGEPLFGHREPTPLQQALCNCRTGWEKKQREVLQGTAANPTPHCCSPWQPFPPSVSAGHCSPCATTTAHTHRVFNQIR